MGGAGRTFMRFVGKPSVFQTPTSPAFIEGCAELFRPRVDETGVSLWQAPQDEAQKELVLAAFAARRPNRRPLKWIELSEDLLLGSGFELLHKPDDLAPCVADRHFELGGDPDSSSLQLAHELRASFVEGATVWGFGAGGVSTLLKRCVEDCDDDALSVFPDWSRRVVGR